MCKDAVCSCLTPDQLLRDRHCSDDNDYGTETHYHQHNVLGFHSKSEDHTFASLVKKKIIKLVDEKVLSISATRDRSQITIHLSEILSCTNRGC